MGKRARIVEDIVDLQPVSKKPRLPRFNYGFDETGKFTQYKIERKPDNTTFIADADAYDDGDDDFVNDDTDEDTTNDDTKNNTTNEDTTNDDTDDDDFIDDDTNEVNSIDPTPELVRLYRNLMESKTRLVLKIKDCTETIAEQNEIIVDCYDKIAEMDEVGRKCTKFI